MRGDCATGDSLRRVIAAAIILASLCGCRTRAATSLATQAPVGAERWWKGNTHTHTLWSDGDDFPEMVAEWYRRAGYHFLAFTEHNTLTDGERWVRVSPEGPGAAAHRKYLERFGSAWVQGRRDGDLLSVRLRRLEEYRGQLEEPGRYLLIPGEEITQYIGPKAAHVNALNLADTVAPQTGATLVEIFRADLERVREQEARTGRDIVAVLNHPNFVWSQTAEDLLELPALRFLEVYNGHPLVNTRGDALHPSAERLWDIVLTERLARGGGLLYGVATDDAHDYHRFAPNQRNPGRGWVMVRAEQLRAEELMAAMKRGDFYASTGVVLDELRRDGNRLSVAVRTEPGVTYAIQFVGTRLGYDPRSVPVWAPDGTPLTRRYSAGVGAVLWEQHSPSATYVIRGDELYVRARVVSSKAKSNPSHPGEMEMAWTQPVRP